ncbi:DNA replication/repair protein RecF [Sphingomonas koreensis]|nr:DNA replication/repair protein RecF [Sphingomonas koreensis]
MLSRLVLTDFRNHAEAVLTPGPGFVVLTGDNGAGKTNVLEAVSLLAPGRGLRRAPLAEMARQGGSGGFGITATLGGDVDLATGIEPGAANRRLVRINGAPAAANALADWLTVLWLTPAMDRLFVEPASERRRFLDRLTLALSPAHATHTTRYEAAMRARNRLLAEARDSGIAPDGQWLTALEAQMAEHGAALDAARRATVTALTEAIARQPEGLFARAGLALDNPDGDASDLVAALAAGRRRDAAAGRTLTGPHRADLAVTHLAKQQAAALCSTGEQKALLLGLILAHADLVTARTGRAPVLLLDEVAAHLDPLRRAALFDRLDGRGQVWLTGTERAPFDAIGAASWYHLGPGAIQGS